jgi:hypothetical protein
MDPTEMGRNNLGLVRSSDAAIEALPYTSSPLPHSRLRLQQGRVGGSRVLAVSCMF